MSFICLIHVHFTAQLHRITDIDIRCRCSPNERIQRQLFQCLGGEEETRYWVCWKDKTLLLIMISLTRAVVLRNSKWFWQKFKYVWLLSKINKSPAWTCTWMRLTNLCEISWESRRSVSGVKFLFLLLPGTGHVVCCLCCLLLIHRFCWAVLVSSCPRLG